MIDDQKKMRDEQGCSLDGKSPEVGSMKKHAVLDNE